MGLLVMVVVMGLGRGQEGEVVATVGDCGVEHSHGVPEPGNGHVGAHHHGTQPEGQDVGDDVLQRVGVHGGDSRGGCPLMVDLVDVFVESRVM